MKHTMGWIIRAMLLVGPFVSAAANAQVPDSSAVPAAPVMTPPAAPAQPAPGMPGAPGAPDGKWPKTR